MSAIYRKNIHSGRWSLRIAVVCVVLIVSVLAVVFIFLVFLAWLFSKEDFGTRRVCV